MTCNWTTARLSAYLDGELGGEEMIQVREHLRGCSCCDKEFAALRVIKRSLAQLSCAGPEPDFEARLIEHVMSQPLAKRRPSPIRYAMVAALVIAVGGTAFMLSNRGSAAVTPSQKFVEADPSTVWSSDPISGQVPFVSTASYNR